MPIFPRIHGIWGTHGSFHQGVNHAPHRIKLHKEDHHRSFFCIPFCRYFYRRWWSVLFEINLKLYLDICIQIIPTCTDFVFTLCCNIFGSVFVTCCTWTLYFVYPASSAYLFIYYLCFDSTRRSHLGVWLYCSMNCTNT